MESWGIGENASCSNRAEKPRMGRVLRNEEIGDTLEGLKSSSRSASNVECACQEGEAGTNGTPREERIVYSRPHQGEKGKASSTQKE